MELTLIKCLFFTAIVCRTCEGIKGQLLQQILMRNQSASDFMVVDQTQDGNAYDYSYESPSEEAPAPTTPNKSIKALGKKVTTKGNTNGCKNCEVEDGQKRMEEAKLYRKEAIKRLLLQKLEMTSFPNVTGDPKYSIPDQILYGKAYRKGDGMVGDDPFQEHDSTPHDKAVIHRVFVFSKVPESSSIQGELSKNAVYFELSENVRTVTSAKMSIYVKADKKNTGKLSIYSMDKLGKQSKHPIFLQHIRIGEKKGSWNHFSLTSEVSSWVNGGAKVRGLFVYLILDGEAPNSGMGQQLLNLQPAHPEDKTHTPFLDIKLEKRSSRDKRRSGMTCSQKHPEKRCCKYDYTVNFDDFGAEFNFILTPRRYQAGYCSGKCPPYFLSFQPATHLSMQSSRKGKRREPCCTPNSVEPLQMMYYNTEKALVMGLIPGMVIESCGCA